MFYAHFVLAKKGPLARIWLAAHWDKKLTKAHVFETNIESSVEGILQPKVKMALRTSGHLLLGIVRIYSRKAKYLLADCNEAFIKIKMAFRPGVVDLPEENRQAEVATITLPEVFHDFDSAMTDINIDMGPQTLNQSRVEDITIKEDFGHLNVIDEDFGMNFDETEMFASSSNMNDFGHSLPSLNPSQLNDSVIAEKEADVSLNQMEDANKNTHFDAALKDDGFGAPVGQGIIDSVAGEFFDAAGLFDDTPLGPEASRQSITLPERTDDRPAEESDDDDDDAYAGSMGPPSFGPPSPPSSPESNHLDSHEPPSEVNPPNAMPPPVPLDIPQQSPFLMPPPPVTENELVMDQTTLIHNEEESFALAPLDSTILHGPSGVEKAKAKRKRKLIVDEVKNISGEEMKSQLSDATDIVTTLDLAPPTKRLMHWKETGGVEKLFALSGRVIPSKTLSKLYQRHLTTKPIEHEDTGLDLEVDLEKSPTPKPLRKRHKPEPQIEPIQYPLEQHIPNQLDSLSMNNASLEMARAGQTFIDNSRLDNPSVLGGFENDSHLAALPPDHPAGLRSTLMSEPDLGLPHEAAVLSTAFDLQTTDNMSLQNSTMNQQQRGLEDSLFQPMVGDHHFPPNQQVPPQQQELMPPNHVSNTPVANDQDLDPFSQLLPADGQHLPSTTTHSDHLMDATEYGKLPIDDDDDYGHDFGLPLSVGPPDEQMADETDEQFEERILTKRTTNLVHILRNNLDRDGTAIFSEVIRNHSRKLVAQKFYTLLVLKKQQILELEQNQPYGEIQITKGIKFEV